MILTVILLYLTLVLAIGALSHRWYRGTGEDYFVATRTIGPFVLLMSLFGTHMTAFSLLGASGEAYLRGVGVFSLMASSSAVIAPLVFLFIGVPVWQLGKRHGYLSPVQFFRERWNSDSVGLSLFIILTALLIPYLLIGVMGGGLTLSQLTKGQVPEWFGSSLVGGVVLLYVTSGGMRGTAWVNTFQTLVFMTLGAVAFVVIVDRLGGLPAVMAKVAEIHPDLLMHGDHIKPLELLTYLCIPLSVGMFPHIFTHWLTARSVQAFRLPIIFYPLCIAIVWLPSVLLGVIGKLDFPELHGPAANSILVMMIERHAPTVMIGLLGAGVFAAIMSSLDSQVLALGNMFTHDIVRHYGLGSTMSDKQQVLTGRAFVIIVLTLTFALSLIVNRSIFKLAIWSFSGYAALVPIAVAALYWKRSTRQGVLASILVVTLLWSYFFLKGWETPGYTIGGTGIMPVAVILIGGVIALVGGSLLTAPPADSHLQKIFGAENQAT